MQTTETFNAGVDHLQAGDYLSALGCFEQVLATDPNHYGAGIYTGIVLQNLGRFAEALPFFLSSAGKQNCLDIHRYLGICLWRLNRYQESIEHFRRFLAVQPDHAEVNARLAYPLLGLGRYPEAWQQNAWRKQTPVFDIRNNYPGTWWRGERLNKDQTLVLHLEQGIGDTLMMARYFPRVRERAPHLIIACPPMFHDLFTHTFQLPCVAADDHPDAATHKCMTFDLPDIFGATIDNIPSSPYLFAAPAAVAQWHAKVQALPARPNVGLCWAGSPRAPESPLLLDAHRSLAFDQLAPLFAISRANFISLQKGVAIWQSRSSELPLIDWTDQLDTLAATAALIANLDLVITVDTAVANLAGAMGKPIWLLNRLDCCWRWQPHNNNPWYSHVRDFRQSVRGDWDAVIQQVCAELYTLGNGNDDFSN